MEAQYNEAFLHATHTNNGLINFGMICREMFPSLRGLSVERLLVGILCLACLQTSRSGLESMWRLRCSGDFAASRSDVMSAYGVSRSSGPSSSVKSTAPGGSTELWTIKVSKAQTYLGLYTKDSHNTRLPVTPRKH
jgi:hypothetical protein